MTLGGCSSTPTATPSVPPVATIHNACALTAHNSVFYDAAKRAERKWGTPAHILLAFVYKESSFVSDAASSSGAYGYAQAKDAAWYDYRKATGRWDASREDIYDAMDFIGWYNYVSYKRLGISRWDAYNLYLAYHEGRGGYARKSYKRRPWVKKLAQRVANQAWRYRAQLKSCTMLSALR